MTTAKDTQLTQLEEAKWRTRHEWWRYTYEDKQRQKQNKYKSSRGNYLSSRNVANLESVLNPFRSRSSLHLWKATPTFTLVLSLVRSSSFFFAFLSSPVIFFFVVLAIYVVVGSSDSAAAGSMSGGRGGSQRVCEEWLTDVRHFIRRCSGSDWLFCLGRCKFLKIAVGAVGGTDGAAFFKQITSLMSYYLGIGTVLGNITRSYFYSSYQLQLYFMSCGLDDFFFLFLFQLSVSHKEQRYCCTTFMHSTGHFGWITFGCTVAVNGQKTLKKHWTDEKEGRISIFFPKLCIIV